MNILIIDEAKPRNCELCGKLAELRPYGPGGKYVCYECGMKDEAEVKRQFLKRTRGQDIIIIK